jgi:hypothetical protein
VQLPASQQPVSDSETAFQDLRSPAFVERTFQFVILPLPELMAPLAVHSRH